MKYERMTERLYGGETVSANGKVYYDEVADIVERLCELEDKIENGELIEKAELEKALAEKQDKGQDLTVKTIFKYNREIKDLKAEIKEYKNKLQKSGNILPCKVGDTVYTVGQKKLFDQTVIQATYGISDNGDYYLFVAQDNNSEWLSSFDTKSIGDWVFLTRAEAEKKLEELGENNETIINL